ncbi:unnamed protein product [Phytomonas sp. EM1]|nr:unnamed protein product [Phytomonas sp. EM1]|eukprot:CCW60777.1 unnamed protein product [Phytomonas sp. isolate EM1]
MGGKRKKSKSGPIKKESRYKIPSRFDCPLCDVKSSIIVGISRSTGIATVHCRSCHVGKGRKWPILPREKGVDVFFRFREELLELDRQFLDNHPMEMSSGGAGLGGSITNLAELSRQENRRLASDAAGYDVRGAKNGAGYGAEKRGKRHRPSSSEGRSEDAGDHNNNIDDVMNFFIPPRFDDEDENDGANDHDSMTEEEQYAAMFA